jgi:hypothetical protein
MDNNVAPRSIGSSQERKLYLAWTLFSYNNSYQESLKMVRRIQENLKVVKLRQESYVNKRC